jgi:hypothetical protein
MTIIKKVNAMSRTVPVIFRDVIGNIVIIARVLQVNPRSPVIGHVVSVDIVMVGIVYQDNPVIFLLCNVIVQQ